MNTHGSDDDQQVCGINIQLQPMNFRVQPCTIQIPNQQPSIAEIQNVVQHSAKRLKNIRFCMIVYFFIFLNIDLGSRYKMNPFA